MTDLNMDRLAKLRQELQEKYEHTNNRVLELRERLSKLWECLEEDQVYRENFLHAHQGCHPDTEQALKEEIRRCDQIKKQKIQVYRENFLHAHQGCHPDTEQALKEEIRRCDQIKKQKIQQASNQGCHPDTEQALKEEIRRCDQIKKQKIQQASNQGCHPDTEQALKEEIRRCDQIKKQKIQVFVANVRTKIKLMWDNVMYSQRQREEFVHYFQDIFTEDTLTLHEMYLDKITNIYNQHKHIFDLVLTRKNLWLKMTELEARATDPARYHNRGGQLLKEEKERKAIANKLPKIEEEIRALVTEYENKTASTFTVDGKPLLQLMEDDWETRKAERHNKLSARKQALTPTTPLLRSLATSPLGKRNRTAAGLATAEKNRPPQKRQLITGSATKAVTTISNNLSALKRSAISTVKRRISGRLAAKAFDGRAEAARKKLDYGGHTPKPNGDAKTPRVAVNGSILKHKRRSQGKRRSSSRHSMSTTHSAASADTRDPLMETTMLTTYTDFKDRLDEKKISRSSMANQQPQVKLHPAADDKRTPNITPKKTPRKAPMTPKVGKENIQHLGVNLMTPKSNLLCTPTRLTRSAMKLDHEGFATPRAPLSATKVNMQRQNTVSTMSVKTPPVNRSKSHTHLVRAKNLPPLI
ncbi:microtubule associated protein (MAP65/ASE1 family) domain-containing protein [Phthorimaea operculella]|nr:microtubule associated protein (MAP65/ASE1 family) domain-containing protein [Phthorimaea operculella]